MRAIRRLIIDFLITDDFNHASKADEQRRIRLLINFYYAKATRDHWIKLKSENTTQRYRPISQVKACFQKLTLHIGSLIFF